MNIMCIEGKTKLLKCYCFLSALSIILCALVTQVLHICFQGFEEDCPLAERQKY